MVMQHLYTISNDFICLFRKENYEKFVLGLMNQSTRTFRGSYSAVTKQANGECDFVDTVTGRKLDAKLPFLSEQIEMLTEGKKHKAEIERWLLELSNEAAEFSPLWIRDNPGYDIASAKLYSIMKQQVEKEKNDEDIVFFIPYPITLSVRHSVFLQFATDYLTYIYRRLADEIELGRRCIYAIYPSSEKNCFALRDISNFYCEYFFQMRFNDISLTK